MRYYGDYIGFRFGEYHSRDLGLYRVSSGDRYNDVSIPQFTDTTTKIPGGDGTYYWDSFYNQRSFTINCAFDDLSETQLRKIRQIFNGKAEDWLIFDEVPYKKYRVKMQGPPDIKYLTFAEGDESNQTFRPRVYKGELTLQFISYYPYAIDNFKAYDDEQFQDDYPNIDEWYSSVPLLSLNQYTALTTNSSLDSGSNAGYFIYNPSDLETDVKIILNWNAVPSDLSIKLNHRGQFANRAAGSTSGDTTIGQLNFTNLAVDSGDTRIVVNTATNLVYGIDAEGRQTGTLYNKYLTSGDFFKLPVTQEKDAAVSSVLTDYCDYLWINVARPTTGYNCQVEYNYLYY